MPDQLSSPPDTTSESDNFKRCRTCGKLKPIRDYMLPRHRQCLECHGVYRSGGILYPLKRIPFPAKRKPKPQLQLAATSPKPRGRPRQPDSLDLGTGEGVKAYMRNRARALAEAKAQRTGLPVLIYRRCIRCCPVASKRVKHHSEFATTTARICIECDAKAPRR